MMRSVAMVILLASSMGVGACTMAHTQVQGFPLESPRAGLAVEPVAEVYANVYGYSFFGLPVSSGAPRTVNSWSFVLFEDATNIRSVTEMILTEARQQGATHVIDLQTHFLSEWIDWSLVVWVAEAEGSATAIRVRDGLPPAGAIPVGPAVASGK